MVGGGNNAVQTDFCWWVVNAAEEDRSKPPSLLSRSLACLRLELNQTRCATSLKLRQCYEKRADDNAKVVDVLQNNVHLWTHVGGPYPELLFRPSAAHLTDCRDAAGRLGELRAREEGDGLYASADEMVKAVELLKSLEWEDIRRERLNMTPPALFSEMVRTAESLLHRQSAEMSDGHTRLAFKSPHPSPVSSKLFCLSPG